MAGETTEEKKDKATELFGRLEEKLTNMAEKAIDQVSQKPVRSIAVTLGTIWAIKKIISTSK